MRYSRVLLLFCVAGINLAAGAALADDEDAFLGQIRTPSEQTMGQGRSAIWTLPLVATQYQPSQPTPAMQAALQAQSDARFLDALILLDDAAKREKAGTEAAVELNLLRSSFLLQGNQSQQALDLLAPLRGNAQHAADAYALSTMAYLQQGKMQEAQDAAQQAQNLGGGMLACLARSYALQAAGRLAEAHTVVHDYNARTPASPITLAREAELALTLDQLPQAQPLAAQAQATDGADPYVGAVSGLVYLLDGHAQEAKTEFEAALKRDPQDAKALFGLGLAEIRLGHLQQGQEKLQAASDADTNNALILTYLGRAQQQLGQTDVAKASWSKAKQADPKDPMPWLYQAQADLQANQPMAARENLQQAQERLAYRAVYRGERLLKQDQQVLQANVAEMQRQLGMEGLAFQTLDDSVGEKSSATLRNEADVLQGQRFGESARRSLLLQSQFNEKPGNLPAELDIYGDGAGQTGAQTPQHGAVSELGAQQSSYNNYDELFTPRAALAVDATAGNQNSSGEQIRAGAGSDTLGVSVAQRQYKTDGLGLFNNLDNRIWQATVQWRPLDSTQVFVSHQAFTSQRGEALWPADPINWGQYNQIEDHSSVTRLGVRYSLSDNSELRGLVSRQQTGQIVNWEWMSDFLPSSSPFATIPTAGLSYGTYHNSSEASSAELQYRSSGADYAMQWGMSSVRSPLHVESFGSGVTNIAQQIYVNWQQALNTRWQLDAGLAWGKNDKVWDVLSANSTSLRRWLPKLGVVYTPDSTTHVRLAAWKNLDDAAVGNASLAPATLAGIGLNRPGDAYKLVQGVGLAADKQLNDAWMLEGRTQRRWTDDPYVNGIGGQILNRRQLDESRLALRWQSHALPLNVTLAYDDEYMWSNPVFLWPDSVQEQHLRSQQLSLRWLASSQWTANLAWSHNMLSATQFSSDASYSPILLDVQDRFNQADASVNWQFNRKGTMDVGVRNAFDRAVLYTEADPLLPRFSKGRLWYARLKLAW